MILLANYTSVYRSKLLINTIENWVKNDQKVLDVGCGNAVVTRELQKYFKIDFVGCDVLDYRKEMIKFVKMKSEDTLPFREKQFDSTIFTDVLHHTSKDTQLKLIKESLRISNKVMLFELLPTIRGYLADFSVNKIHNRKMSIPFTYRKLEDWKNVFRSFNVSYKTKLVKSPWWYPFSHVAFLLY